ncbi:hypothetical protein GCM10027586_21360 [Kineococcus gypseus]|uniref:hypothetical protein n=1 Tax=Kineococcus gypseus TaxID=1637102 RepID=UPI003D7DD636
MTPRRLVLLGMGVALLGACGSPPSEIDGPVIVITGELRSTMQGTAGPVLALEDGCLRFGAGGGVLVWGKGTTWDEKTQEVVSPQGARLRIGEPITVNSSPVPDLEQALGREGAEAAEACGGADSPGGRTPEGASSALVGALVPPGAT